MRISNVTEIIIKNNYNREYWWKSMKIYAQLFWYSIFTSIDYL